MTTAMFIITSNNKTPQSLRSHSCLHLLRRWNNWWQLTQGGSEVRHQCSLCWNATCQSNYRGRGLRLCDVTWTAGLIWERCKAFSCLKKKKHWVDLYHYRVVVYTFQFKQLVKVHVALYNPLQWLLKPTEWNFILLEFLWHTDQSLAF